MIITTCGHPVRTNSPGCSANRLSIVRSANVSAVNRPLLVLALLLFPLELLALVLLLFVPLDAFDEVHVSMFICVVDDTSVAKCMTLFFFVFVEFTFDFSIFFNIFFFTFSLRFFGHSKCKNAKFENIFLSF